MHDSASIPPDPESERRGHELRDVAIKPILFFLIGLFIFGGVIQTLMTFVMSGFIAADTQVGVLPVSIEDSRIDQKRTLTEMFRDEGQTTHPGALQRDTTGDMLRMYDDENKILNYYHKDAKTGQIRIPIDRAIEIVAKKGLPHRDTPKELIDKDLPYLTHSQPYMSTR